MKNIFDAWALTLAHSLWQAMLIFMVVTIALKFFPANATARYRIAVAGLVLFFAASALTFYTLLPDRATVAGATATLYLGGIATPPISAGWLALLQNTLLSHVDFILTVWLFGATLFLLRITGSWWYIRHLEETGAPVEPEWERRVIQLARQLGVNRAIRLVKSTRIDAPFMSGILNPVIFVPVGLASGLSAEQIEAIFIHELIHIRRHDFLVNVFQSLVESLFFFNPFIWKVSEIIRTEREHCCDDAVVKFGADKKAYVYALASLEEARLGKHGLALSAAGTKHQLFKRIKRLMEGSTKNYSLREKLVPVVLLAVGLMCASWFSIQRKNAPTESLSTLNAGFVQDTTIRKKDKTKPVKNKPAKDKSKPEKSAAKENDDLSLEGDFAPLPPMPHLEIPEPPDFDIDIPELVEIHPGLIGPMGFSAESHEEFLEKFKARFGEFYEKNQEEIKRIVAEVERERHREMANLHVASARAHDDLMRHQESVRHLQEAQFRDHEAKMREFEAKMRVWEQENQEHVRKMEANIAEFEKRVAVFNGKLREELIRDGYITKDENIDRIHIREDQVMEVNGKRIKESDVAKYKEFYKKNFPKMKGE